MPVDVRFSAARFYDYNPGMPQDIPFYVDQIRSKDQSILELGCGTGRVLIPLSRRCGFIHGIDKSDAMISICRQKLIREGISETRARIDVADISLLKLGRQFNLIIAPFRVLQNLEMEVEIKGLFRGIRSHLKPDGSCILNTFNPFGDRDAVIKAWMTPVEELEWEVPFEDGNLTCSCRRTRIDIERMAIYPELIYRVHKRGKVFQEARLQIVMKCYWPDQLVQLVESEGFRIKRRWGGYQDQEYGKGPELIVEIEMGG